MNSTTDNVSASTPDESAEETTELPQNKFEDTTKLPAGGVDETTVIETTPGETIMAETVTESPTDTPSELTEQASAAMSEPSDDPADAMSEPSIPETEAPSPASHEGSPMPESDHTPAFSPLATGERHPSDSPKRTFASADPSAQPFSNQPQYTGQEPMGEPSHRTGAPSAEVVEERGIKFGLLTWGLILILIGVAVVVMPWAPQIDWNLVAVFGFGGLGVIMLLVALSASLASHRRQKKS